MHKLTGTQIGKLNDEDLRELVFRLCEAELRRNSQPIVSVTAGGNQTAPDGGIDVRVELPATVKLDFIPRSRTGFQVKCEDMSAAKIAKEMCPDGKLRASIVQLIESHGAYIIVSSKGSVADGPLLKRREAMHSAIKSVSSAAGAHLDFYDRDRLANWVRSYPGVELWMRGRIGEQLSGWQGYCNWTGDKADAPYLKDDSGRLFSKTTGSPEAMSVERGLDAIRKQLEIPGEAVRLIGLSGTGKTRFVQALFESGAGGQPLDRSIVVYTDQGNSPQPSARDMMQTLGANGLRAIVVVDNCNPATHQALTRIVAIYSAFLSLITVEYDVMDDEPEETHVFELTGSSATVLEEILARLAPHVAQSDRRRIVEFSDGNARVALALVRTLKKGQTLGILNDVELFKRLFMQNHEPNETLLRAAEACSLVYSFDGEIIYGANAELPVLAALADLTPKELLRQIANLRARKLVQTRGKWRAVLPHALANKLAKQALANLPRSEVMSVFLGHDRLLKSFGRRLGYLHDSTEACAIAQSWLTDEKWLANPCALNELGWTLFLNLAPLVPEQALTTLEMAVNGEQGIAFTASTWPSRDRWMDLARSLAYEANLFDRAARICLAYAEAEEPQQRTGKDVWKELFYMYLSGTMAPPQQRFNFIRRILTDDIPRQREMALLALSGMLQSSNFRSSRDFSFGARPRKFGWEPDTVGAYRAWYRGVFELVVELSGPDSRYRDPVRTAVAGQLRSLWGNLGMHDEVAALVKTLAGTNGWPEGWAATRIALRHDSKSMPLEHFEMLTELERMLRPVTLEQNVRSYVFSEAWGHLDIADGEVDDGAAEIGLAAVRERVIQRVEGLAREVVADQSLLQKLLPDLLLNGSGQKYEFGKGLAMASHDITACWDQLCTAFSQIELSKRDSRLLVGFIEGAGQVDLVNAELLLDSAVRDPILAAYFPRLQGSQCSDSAGKRLLDSLDYGVAPVSTYYWVSFRLRSVGMSAALYRDILLKLASMPEGFRVAIDSLGMEFHRSRSEKSTVDAELISLGRELLGLFNFDVNDHNFGYQLNEVAAVCMRGSEAAAIAITVCQRFAEALHDYQSGADSLGALAGTLFRYQPEAALDAFLAAPRKARLSALSMSKKSVVNCADIGALTAWVKVEPAVRAPLLAAEIEVHCQDLNGVISWSPVAARLLEIAPNKKDVLAGFAEQTSPQWWSGSIAHVLRPYQELATRLANSADAEEANWARGQLDSMAERIARERRIDQRTDERFE